MSYAWEKRCCARFLVQHHLIDGRVSAPQVFFTGAVSSVINDLGLAVGEQNSVVTALGEKAWWVVR